MRNQTIFLLIAIILVTAVVTTALFTVKHVVAQPANMTKNMTGAAAKISNLTKAMGPAAGGGKRPG